MASAESQDGHTNINNSTDFTAVVSLLRQAESLLSCQNMGQSSPSVSAINMQISSQDAVHTTRDATNENTQRQNEVNGETTTQSSARITQSNTVQVVQPVADRALSNFRQLFAPYATNRFSSPLPTASLGQGRARVSSYPQSKRPRRSNIRSNGRSFVMKETWTHDFFCLASAVQSTQPSRSDKLSLQAAGLGRKTLTFGLNDDASAFIAKVEAVYPKIKTGGGFDLLRSGATNKELMLITPPLSGYTVPFLRESSGIGQAIIYIRPMQRSLELTAVVPVFQVY